jgi:hypothetical protein
MYKLSELADARAAMAGGSRAGNRVACWKCAYFLSNPEGKTLPIF